MPERGSLPDERGHPGDAQREGSYAESRGSEPQEESGLPRTIGGAVVTVGTFDGLHLGHREVVRRLVERAREKGWASVLVTFRPHPLEVVDPAAAPLLLSTSEEKSGILASTGLDYAVVLPFTPVLQRYTPEQFVGLLISRYAMRELLMGYDHGFGSGRSGSVETLQALGAVRGFGVEVAAPVTLLDGRKISSSMIRRAIAAGALDEAAAALGRPYSIEGTVVPGERRGRQLGFPTLNVLVPDARKLLPPDGVYAVRVQTPSGAFGGMMNVGGRPTFGDGRRSIEAHLFDTQGDWYGAHVRVDLVSHLRETRRFADAGALAAQLRRDEADAREVLSVLPPVADAGRSRVI